MMASNNVQGRVVSIDVFRGFFLFIMVLVHFIIAFSSEEATNSFLYFFFDDALADWGAASFLLMMGMSQVLSAKRVGEVDNLLLFKRALLRGAYIFLVGLLMLICAWGFEELWIWDILTLMGVATVILFFCRFLPSWLLITFVVIVALVTPYLRDFFDIASHWGGGFEEMPFISYYLPGMFANPFGEYASSWHFTEIAKGFFFAGYFPVMPWIIFPVIGFVLGRRLIKDKLRNHLPKLMVGGLLFICSAFIIAYMGRGKPPSSAIGELISPMCFYPDSFSMVNFQVGMSVFVFCIFYFFFDMCKKNKTKLNFISRILIRTSNFSLTFYFLHYMLIGWPLRIYALVSGGRKFEPFFGAASALIFGFAAVVFLEILLHLWEKKNSKYSFEWGLAKLTKFVFPSYERSVRRV